MSQLDAVLTGLPLTMTFDLEFTRSNCISGMGGPIVIQQKGRELIGCPDVKHNHNVTSRQKILLRTRVIKEVGISVDLSGLMNIIDVFIDACIDVFIDVCMIYFWEYNIIFTSTI